MRVVPVIPAYALTEAELRGTVSRLPALFGRPLVVVNDAAASTTARTAMQLQSEALADVHFVPWQVGKAEAMRIAMTRVRDVDFDAVVQLDGDLKQPPEDTQCLVDAWTASGADMVVANRYAYQDLESQPHRATISGALAQIVRHMIQVDLFDCVCGMRLYSRALALAFVDLRSYGYGLEIEQLLIAGIHDATIVQARIRSDRQSGFTPGEKIVENIAAILAHGADYALGHETRTHLCSIVAAIKARRDFTIDLSAFGGRGCVSARWRGVQDEYAFGPDQNG